MALVRIDYALYDPYRAFSGMPENEGGWWPFSIFAFEHPVALTIVAILKAEKPTYWFRIRDETGQPNLEVDRVFTPATVTNAERESNAANG